jgi:hypothetical protein
LSGISWEFHWLFRATCVVLRLVNYFQQRAEMYEVAVKKLKNANRVMRKRLANCASKDRARLKGVVGVRAVASGRIKCHANSWILSLLYKPSSLLASIF